MRGKWWKCGLIVSAALVVLAMPSASAGTVTTTIRPNGQLFESGWILTDDGCSSDSTRWDELAENSPHDADGTCRASNTIADTLQILFDDLQGAPSDVLDIDVRVVLIGRTTGDVTLTSFFGSPSCEPVSVHNLPGIGAFGAPQETYTSAQLEAETCGSTGNALDDHEWTDSFVNGLRLSVDCDTTLGTGTCFITQAFAEVIYTTQDPGPGVPAPQPEDDTMDVVAATVIRATCNLFFMLFLAVVVAVAIGIRRARMKGPG